MYLNEFPDHPWQQMTPGKGSVKSSQENFESPSNIFSCMMIYNSGQDEHPVSQEIGTLPETSPNSQQFVMENIHMQGGFPGKEFLGLSLASTTPTKEALEIRYPRW